MLGREKFVLCGELNYINLDGVSNFGFFMDAQIILLIKLLYEVMR